MGNNKFDPPNRPLFDWADEDRKNANPSRWAAARAVTPPNFAGGTLDPNYDEVRLTGQMLAVFNVMKDGRWRTLTELKAEVGKGTETGLSAALRALRKPKFGAHRVERNRRGDKSSGLWEYKLFPSSNNPPIQ